MISATKTLGFSISRRSTRRIVVLFYWSLFAVGCFAFVKHQTRHGFDGRTIVFGLQFLFFLTALLGGVRAGGFVKPFRGVHWIPVQETGGLQSLFKPTSAAILEGTSLDERENSLRDRIHFVAFTLTRWFALFLFVLYGVLGLIRAEWLIFAGSLFFFLLMIVLWSLPQTLILWTEPDLEVSQ